MKKVALLSHQGNAGTEATEKFFFLLRSNVTAVRGQ